MKAKKKKRTTQSTVLDSVCTQQMEQLVMLPGSAPLHCGGAYASSWCRHSSARTEQIVLTLPQTLQEQGSDMLAAGTTTIYSLNREEGCNIPPKHCPPLPDSRPL
jgi:hypothetical protein